MNTIDQLFATLPANVRETVEDLVDDHGWALHAIPLPACADALNAVLAAGHILTRCVPVDATALLVCTAHPGDAVSLYDVCAQGIIVWHDPSGQELVTFAPGEFVWWVARPEVPGYFDEGLRSTEAPEVCTIERARQLAADFVGSCAR